MSENGSSLLLQILKNISTSDLLSLKAPISFTKSISMLEQVCLLHNPTDAIVDLLNEQDSSKRMLYIVSLLLETIPHLYSNRFVSFTPYNSVTGEHFHCFWKHKDGSTTKFFAEQVHRMPPTSVYGMVHSSKKFQFLAHHSIKPRLGLGKIFVESVGSWKFTLINCQGQEEIYYFYPPPLILKNFLFGNGFIGPNGASKVVCASTNTVCEMTYGDCVIEGKILQNNVVKYEFSGHIQKEIQFKTAADKSELFCVNFTSLLPKNVKRIEEQEEMETQKFWNSVTVHLNNNELEKAKMEKQKLEQKIEQILKEYKYNPRYFITNETTQEYEFNWSKINELM